MTLDELIQASRDRTASLRDTAQGNPLMPVMGPSTQEEASRPDKMAMLMALMSQGGQSPGGSMGSTYVGGNGDFNETHEGPGLDGLVRGSAWDNYDTVQRLANRIENRFGIDVGSGIVNRNIAGSSSPSEHAYGAAADIMTGVNQQLQDRINAWLNKQRIAEKFGYSNILGYWNRPDDHSNHIHVGWLY